MKACQLFCLLHFSLKKEFDPNSAVSLFCDWVDIHKYMMGSTKLYQDVQTHLKSKIESLEFNYEFVTVLLKEY